MRKRYLLFLLPILFLAYNVLCVNEEKEKINGVSFVAPPKEIGKEEIAKPQEKIAANYLSIMPYAFIPENGKKVVFDENWQWWGETTEGAEQTIIIAHNLGYKVMLKPHVWKRHGEYTGDHRYETEENWKLFEDSFSKYILHYAEIAEKQNVSIFCIGTEWKEFALSRPQFWGKLIKEIRKKYEGKLTYAANWDEYKKISFWDKLDFIGVDAYFPLISKKTPTEEEIEKGLVPYKNELMALSDSIEKGVLFTEYGYRSRDNNAEKPWESDRGGEVNLQAQEKAYSGFYRTFWEEDFIEGGFLWKWFHNHEDVGGKSHNGYSPQNKPAEMVIKRRYSN